MKHSLFPALLSLACLAALCSMALRAEAPPPPENDPLIRVAEGKIYAVVNGENILGREVLDVLAETAWQQYITPFVTFSIREMEIDKAKVTVESKEVDAAAELYLKAQFGNVLDLVKLEKEAGAGAVEALKRTVKADLGLLKIFQSKNQLPPGALITSREFVKLNQEFLQKRVDALGVISDPKELGEGEAVRIGPRSYSRDEVRRFILEAEGQLPKSMLGKILNQLVFEKVINAEAARKKLALSEDDRNFHFSYLCRVAEQETGAPGRAAMMQQIQNNKLTADQYIHSRIFSCDALATLIVKQKIELPNLRAAFAVNPKKYQGDANLMAHIFIQVLDPEGHPYNSQWRANHFGPDAFVAQKREEQFAKLKSKIDGLVPLAKENFEATASKQSDDISRKAGGLIGRIGPRIIPAEPLDKHVVEAAIKLKPGQVSDPVRSDFGWHILKCLEKQEVTFEEVSEAVYLDLIREARKELIENLLKTAKVEDKQ